MKNRFKKWKDFKPKHNEWTPWNWLALYPQYIFWGKHTDFGAFTLFNAKDGSIIIEDGVQIGSHCVIQSCSTIDGKTGVVLIQKGACIGTHSTVMPGVTVGAGAIVAAHSFVNCDVPDGETWGGVPVTRIRGKLGRNKQAASSI